MNNLTESLNNLNINQNDDIPENIVENTVENTVQNTVQNMLESIINTYIPENIVENTVQNNTPHTALVSFINTAVERERMQDIWGNSPFRLIKTLRPNNVGMVGEKWLGHVCNMCNIPAQIDGTLTKQRGGGTGDGTIRGHTIEIKTACLGINKEFQHELAEDPWKADYLVFIDIAPECFYLTIIPNFSEELYKSGNKCKPFFPTKKITRRKDKGNFKFDTSPNLNEQSVTKGNAIKITETTSVEDIASFINIVIN
jgi:hypothetical protein